ncbi:MAG: CCA tRNA nucleotidyltransferase [Planctomycetes bacterium]|nr:CCA tRNA nucleotidyltransferase [Planctomycetota bacterium]
MERTLHETRAIGALQRLRDAGFESWFAGGCVRDRVLGRAAKDIDIATAARPEQVEAIFGRTVAVGRAFGVIRVRIEDSEFEVATFRSDGVYTDGRHPDAVTFSDAKADVQRRDFTINGLLYDPIADCVIDHVGGMTDCEARIIRAIGDPFRRFEEDHLRLLRAVRFACQLGFAIEPATRAAIVERAPAISTVSGERVRDEIRRILESPRRSEGIREMHALGLLRPLLPEVAAMEGVPQPPEFHPEGDVWVHTLLALEKLESPSFVVALAELLHDVGKPVTITHEDRIRFNEHEKAGERMAVDICDRLRLSAAERDHIAWMVGAHMLFKDTPRMRPAKLKRLLAHPGFDDLAEMHRADCLASHGSLGEHERLTKLKRETPPEVLAPPPLVTGHDVLALGIPSGPRVGELLRAVKDAQLEGRLFSREEAMEFLRRLAREGREEQ